MEDFERGEYLPDNIPMRDYIKNVEQRTGIDWADDAKGSVMSSMPDELKTYLVGKKTKNRFLKRYYENVLDVIKPGGFQEQLIKSGDLRRLPNGKWEGRYLKQLPSGEWVLDTEYTPVWRPEDYVKVRLARSKGTFIELPIPNGVYSNYLMHGTRGNNIHSNLVKYITDPRESPGKEGLWTIPRDGISENVIAGYKNKMAANAPDVGYSIPFARYPKLEISKPFEGGSSYNLEPLVNSAEFNGRVMRPFGVKDANFPDSPLIREYIFGPNAPMPKSLWNTLDFEEGAGPLANNTEQNNKFDYINHTYLT